MDEPSENDTTFQEMNLSETKREVKVVIDPDGDVYLHLKDTELPSLELRVSSKVLATASKVFAAMFKPSFQEGLTIAKGESCHIPLPDDPTAMHILCLVVHHKELTGSLVGAGSHRLLMVVILADKYACIGAIECWAGLSVERKLNAMSFNEVALVDMLLAAYLLDHVELFKKITTMMVQCKPPLSSDLSQRNWLRSREAHDMLPPRLIRTSM